MDSRSSEMLRQTTCGLGERIGNLPGGTPVPRGLNEGGSRMKKALVGMTLAAMLLASGCGTFGSSGNSDYWDAANVARGNAADYADDLDVAAAETRKAVEAAEKTRAAAMEAADARRQDALGAAEYRLQAARESAADSNAVEAAEIAYTIAVEAAQDRYNTAVDPVRDVEAKWSAVVLLATVAREANVTAAKAIEARDVYMSVLGDGTDMTDMATAAAEASRRAVEASDAIYAARVAEAAYRAAAREVGIGTEE